MDIRSAIAVPYAGGTDLLLRWARGLAQKPQLVVDLKGVRRLHGISQVNDQVCIGACTLMSEIASDPLIRSLAPVLAHAAGRIACPQVRNRATIGGNLCNASPAADTAVPLILLDAVIESACATRDGVAMRVIPITDFFRGPGSTTLKRAEILTRVRFTPPSDAVFSAWDKFGTRPAMEIAVASVGVVLEVKGNEITHARVGYGSVAPVPLRGRGAEAELVGSPLSDESITRCEAAARSEIAPISDVRAGEQYRREVVGVMLRRMLERAGRG